MQHTRTLLAGLMASTIFAGASLAAEMHPKTGEALADNQTFTYRLLDSIKSLDPQINTDVEGSGILRNLFEGLMNEARDGSLQPGVAESFALSDDKKTYTFTLRQDAKWANGDPVTAKDFEFAWKRLADPATASEYAWYMELMQVQNAAKIIAGEMEVDTLGAKAIDDYTFEVTIETPLPYFPSMTVHASTFPVHAATIETHGDKWTDVANIMGNGAYTLAERAPGEKLTLKRNPMYWDDANTVLEEITALVINDENQAFTRYLANEVDRTQVPAGQYPTLKEKYPDETGSYPYSCSYIYMYNMSEKGPEALKDVRVRKALSLTIDRDIVTDKILQGGQRPSYNWTHWATANFEVPEIDMAKMTQAERDAMAVSLLAEAGYSKDNPLSLTLQYNTSDAHKKIAVAVQQMWKQKLGIDLTLENYEWKVHTDRMQNQDFDMARYAWCGDYNEASTYLDLFASYSGHNNGHYFSDEYDKLITESKTAADPQPLYEAAEQQMAKDVPFAPIYHYAKVDIMKSSIKGWPVDNVQQTWYGRELYRAAE